jgi:hypothetical protein
MEARLAGAQLDCAPATGGRAAEVIALATAVANASREKRRIISI